MGGDEEECEAESTGWGVSGAVFGGDDGGGVDEGDGDGGECVVGDGVEGRGDAVSFGVERHSRGQGCCITSFFSTRLYTYYGKTARADQLSMSGTCGYS